MYIELHRKLFLFGGRGRVYFGGSCFRCDPFGGRGRVYLGGSYFRCDPFGGKRKSLLIGGSYFRWDPRRDFPVLNCWKTIFWASRSPTFCMIHSACMSDVKMELKLLVL